MYYNKESKIKLNLALFDHVHHERDKSRKIVVVPGRYWTAGQEPEPAVTSGIERVAGTRPEPDQSQTKTNLNKIAGASSKLKKR